MITVWGRASSSNVQAVMWALAELRVPCVRVDVGHKYGGNDTPAFLAMNPNGTVPVLQDGAQTPIWETGAILRYLAERYADDLFWPKDAAARAAIDQWAEWAKINVALKFTAPVFWRVVRTAPSRQDPQAIAEALTVLNGYLKIAEEQLARQSFLAAAHLTLADIQFGHLLYRYFDIAIARPSFPHIARYYERLTDRAAYQAHVMVSYDALRITVDAGAP